MKALFLDIDGVLNAHDKLPSGYCGIGQSQVSYLNWILRNVPDCHLVISSAWRYIVIRGDMTLKGFEYMLMVHGVDCFGRLHGHTESDEDIFANMGHFDSHHFDAEEWHQIGLRCRPEQVLNYVRKHDIKRFAVVDDLDLAVPNFVRTDGAIGMTAKDAQLIIDILK